LTNWRKKSFVSRLSYAIRSGPPKKASSAPRLLPRKSPSRLGGRPKSHVHKVAARSAIKVTAEVASAPTKRIAWNGLEVVPLAVGIRLAAG
jgi:hypothetical protein